MGGVRGVRRFGVLVVCVVAAQACDCGDTRLIGVRPERLRVEVRGGVSCDGAPAALTAYALGGTEPYSYQWDPAGGLDDAASPAPIATVAATRDYRVGWPRTARTGTRLASDLSFPPTSSACASRSPMRTAARRRPNRCSRSGACR
jgi:hypothetical protein